jgi:diaminohydroxyphosphoribosylaminopyrimidine deaminase/5-amino-6-(5-phosphoribosylamino)uracil reductase
VILKSAMSLDGRTAMASGESFWITGPEARAQVQVLRAQSDAIITGRGTVKQDDPNLNVRDEKICALPFFKQPKRIVLDSNGQCHEAKLFKAEGESWLVTAQTHPTDAEGKISLPELLAWLAELPCNQVMVEAGAVLSAAFLKAGLVDEWHVFIAPKIMGSSARPLCDVSMDTMAEAQGLSLSSVTTLGQDLYCIFVPLPSLRGGTLTKQSSPNVSIFGTGLLRRSTSSQ